MAILEIKNLSYAYPDGENYRVIFDHLNLSFDLNHFYAVLGDSGSGKTTLLSVIAGLDALYQGEIFYKGEEIKKIGLDKYKRNAVSMIFQSYNLIPHLNALENCFIAMDISENVKTIDRKKVEELLFSFGLDQKKTMRKVSLLSGGEQQRVAIARAILCGSPIIIADEPTGNLDAHTALLITETLAKLSREGKCIIMVTHNEKLAHYADTILKIDQEHKTILPITNI